MRETQALMNVVTDNLVHLTYLLYLFSYLVRDILKLRTLAVIAALNVMLYFYFLPEPLWKPIAWNVLFVGVNLYQITALLRQRKPVTLTDEEQRLHDTLFRGFSPREMRSLLQAAEWQEVAAASTILDEGIERRDMFVILEGEVDIIARQQRVARLGPGRLLGEMGFLTGAVSSAGAVAHTPVRIARWSYADLEKWLSKRPNLRGNLQAMIGIDLAHKLAAGTAPATAEPIARTQVTA